MVICAYVIRFFPLIREVDYKIVYRYYSQNSSRRIAFY